MSGIREKKYIDWQARIDAANTEEELSALRIEIVANVQDIDSQLGDRNRLDASGARMSDHEWWGWRSRATTAKRKMNDALRRLNEKLKRSRIARHSRPAQAGTLEESASKAWLLLQRLGKEGVDFDPDEWSVVDELRASLRSAGVNPNMVTVPWRPAGENGTRGPQEAEADVAKVRTSREELETQTALVNEEIDEACEVLRNPDASMPERIEAAEALEIVSGRPWMCSACEAQTEEDGLTVCGGVRRAPDCQFPEGR
jgi:hypothetical protein